MKIQAIDEKLRSTKLQVPYDGLISIDANGVAEVSEKAAEILVKGTNDWKYLKGRNNTNKAEKVEENASTEPEPTEDISSLDEESSETEEDETKTIIEGIKKMSLEDMLSMAKEAGYPKSEYEKFAKKDKMMAAYLIKKYNESQR